MFCLRISSQVTVTCYIVALRTSNHTLTYLSIQKLSIQPMTETHRLKQGVVDKSGYQNPELGWIRQQSNAATCLVKFTSENHSVFCNGSSSKLIWFQMWIPYHVDFQQGLQTMLGLYTSNQREEAHKRPLIQLLGNNRLSQWILTRRFYLKKMIKIGWWLWRSLLISADNLSSSFSQVK